MTRRLLYVTFWFTSHCIPWLSLQWLMLYSLHSQSQGCVLMSLDCKVRKTITYSGTGVRKVLHPLIYSMFVFIPVLQREDCLCVFVIFLDCVLPWASLSLHGRGDKRWVTPQAGGADAMAQLSVCFPSFLTLFFTLLLPFLSNISL